MFSDRYIHNITDEFRGKSHLEALNWMIHLFQLTISWFPLQDLVEILLLLSKNQTQTMRRTKSAAVDDENSYQV